MKATMELNGKQIVFTGKSIADIHSQMLAMLDEVNGPLALTAETDKKTEIHAGIYDYLSYSRNRRGQITRMKGLRRDNR